MCSIHFNANCLQADQVRWGDEGAVQIVGGEGGWMGGKKRIFVGSGVLTAVVNVRSVENQPTFSENEWAPSTCFLLHTAFFLDLYFYPEVGGNMFFQTVC
jgi:hypothetical protein